MSDHVVPLSSEYSRTYPSNPASVCTRCHQDRRPPPGPKVKFAMRVSGCSVTTAGSGQNHELIGECDAVFTIDQGLAPVPPVVSHALPPDSTLSVTVVVGPLGTTLRSVLLESVRPLLQGPLPVVRLSSARTL